MKPTSTTLAAAIAARERVISVRLGVDWDGDGMGPWDSGHIDDLSDKAGSIRITRSLVGYLPDQVRVVEGSAAADMTADLVRGSTTDERVHAAAYFSRFNTGSPLYGKERHRRPTTVDIGFQTAAGGIEWVRAFTGRTRRLPVNSGDRTAQLEALDLRELLRATVTLPAVRAVDTTRSAQPWSPGMEATWIVTYALAAAGIYVSPPPRPGCRLWWTMHGSAYPLISGLSIGPTYMRDANGQDHPWTFSTAGPWFMCTDAPTGGPSQISSRAHATSSDVRFLTTAGRAVGRVEAWIYMPAAATTWQIQATGAGYGTGGTYTVEALSTGQLRLTVQESTTVTVTGPTLPFDGAWHFVGAWFDSAAGQVRWRVDSTTTSGTFTPATTSGNAAVVDDFAVFLISGAGVRWADVQITGGTTATDQWLNQITWTPGAVVDRSTNTLDGIAQVATTDAWSLLTAVAEAEQAAVGLDDFGVLQYRTRARLASTAAQTVQRSLTADTALIDSAYDDSIDTVRNHVIGSYQPITVHNYTSASDPMWQPTAVVAVPAGTAVTLWMDTPPILSGYQVSLRACTDATGAAGQVDSCTRLPLASGIEAIAGTGVLRILVTRITSVSATLRISNTGGQQVWLVDTSGASSLLVYNDWLEQTATATVDSQDATSIGTYGDQPLTLPSTPWVQQRLVCQALTDAVRADLSQPAPYLTGVVIVGDPRLELGDRVTIVDTDGMALAGDYWLTSISDELDMSSGSLSYTQTISARRARSTGAWDQTVAWWDSDQMMWGA